MRTQPLCVRRRTTISARSTGGGSMRRAHRRIRSGGRAKLCAELLALLALHLAQDQHREVAFRRKIGLRHLEFGVAGLAHALAAETDKIPGLALVDREMELADGARPVGAGAQDVIDALLGV